MDTKLHKMTTAAFEKMPDIVRNGQKIRDALRERFSSQCQRFHQLSVGQKRVICAVAVLALMNVLFFAREIGRYGGSVSALVQLFYYHIFSIL